MTREDLAQLELELRRLPGVVLVTFDPAADTTVVELTVEEGAGAADGLRHHAQRLIDMQFDGAAVVRVLDEADRQASGGSGSRLRVQLVAVAPGSGGRVDIHLAYRGRRAASSCRAGDRIGVAGAVLDALGKLGLRIPFVPAAVHLLPLDLGEGALVHLRYEGRDGVRRGLAGGRAEEEAIARAVLNGLNRYLEESGAMGLRQDDPDGGGWRTAAG